MYQYPTEYPYQVIDLLECMRTCYFGDMNLRSRFILPAFPGAFLAPPYHRIFVKTRYVEDVESGRQTKNAKFEKSGEEIFVPGDQQVIPIEP